MIKLITGKKGSGKTKILIDQINNAVKDTNGCLVCVEKGETLRRSISYKVRWCDAEKTKKKKKMQNSLQLTASQHSMASLLVCWLATMTSRKSS